jgi:predicted thioesterase
MAMTVPLSAGQTGAAHTVVTEANTAQSMGSGSMPVYATPALVALLEEAAVNALKPVLEAGKTTVGTRIEVAHVAATPVGHAVRSQATLTAVDDRRLVFEVVAYDEVEQIAHGVHERVLVDEQRFLARVQEKAPRPA